MAVDWLKLIVALLAPGQYPLYNSNIDTKPTMEAIYDYLKKIDGKIDDLRTEVAAIDLKFVKLSHNVDDLILAQADLKADVKIIGKQLSDLESHYAPTEKIR